MFGDKGGRIYEFLQRCERNSSVLTAGGGEFRLWSATCSRAGELLFCAYLAALLGNREMIHGYAITVVITTKV